MSVYLLSIAGNIAAMLSIVAAFLFLLGGAEVLVTIRDEKIKGRKLIIASIILIIIASMIPNRKDLVESYIIVKSKHVIDNPQQTIATIDSLINKLNNIK